jgi:hypothetical protein
MNVLPDLKASFAAAANYDLDEELHGNLQLANLGQVVEQLAGAGRDKLFLTDLASVVTDDMLKDAASREVLDIFIGCHSNGFRMTVVEAAGRGGGPMFIPLIEDTAGDRMLVVAAAAAPPISAGNIQYVDATDSDAARDVNAFIAIAADRQSSVKQTSPVAERQKLAEILIRAVSATAEIVPDQEKGVVLPRAENMVGDVMVSIAKGEKKLTIFSVAAQKFDDGSLAEKLKPEMFHSGAEKQVTVSRPLRLTVGV